MYIYVYIYMVICAIVVIFVGYLPRTGSVELQGINLTLLEITKFLPKL